MMGVGAVFAPLGQKQRVAGFALMEILVAVAILAMAYLAILESYSQSFRNLAKIERVWRQDFAALSPRELDLRAISAKAEVEPLAGEVFLAGQKFQLVLVPGPDSHPGRSCLLLERRP